MILKEKYLTSDFRFGFEFEAILHEEGTLGIVSRYAEKTFGKDMFDMKEDPTIKPNPDQKLHWDTCSECEGTGYEYTDEGDEIECAECNGTGKTLDKEHNVTFELTAGGNTGFPFDITNIERTIQFLYHLLSENIAYTNTSCGFHVHLSFPNITRLDALWFMLNLSFDVEAQELFSGMGKYSFETPYSSMKVTDIYSKIIEKLRKGNTKIAYEVNSILEKDVAFRLHTYNTIEWRGPRNFMNEKKLDDIVEFFKLLYRLVKYINETLDVTELAGMDKKFILKNIVKNMDVKDRMGKKYSQKSEEIIDLISNKKEVNVGYVIENKEIILFDFEQRTQTYFPYEYIFNLKNIIISAEEKNTTLEKILNYCYSIEVTLVDEAITDLSIPFDSSAKYRKVISQYSDVIRGLSYYKKNMLIGNTLYTHITDELFSNFVEALLVNSEYVKAFNNKTLNYILEG